MSKILKSSLRSVAAVFGGYLLLALTNMAFVIFRFVQQSVTWDPILTLFVAIPYTLGCGALAGYLIGWIAGRYELRHAGFVATLMVLVTLLAMTLGQAVEPRWYQIAYAIVMAPSVVLGGWMRERSRRN